MVIRSTYNSVNSNDICIGAEGWSPLPVTPYEGEAVNFLAWPCAVTEVNVDSGVVVSGS